MVGMLRENATDQSTKFEDLLYIHEMLGELRVMADRNSAAMLCYLIDMAFHETTDLMNAERARSGERAQ